MGSILTLMVITKPSIVFQPLSTLSFWRKMLSCCFNSLTWKSGKRDRVASVIYGSCHESHPLDFDFLLTRHLEGPPVRSYSSETRRYLFSIALQSKLNWRSEKRNTFFTARIRVSGWRCRSRRPSRGRTAHCLPSCLAPGSLGPARPLCCASLT